MIGSTNWNPSNVYDCSGTNKRCYGGVCRTCNGYFRYGYQCWHYASGRQGYSCTENCASYGGCYYESFHNDDTSTCEVCRYFVGGSGCDGGDNTDRAPARVRNTWGTWQCKYRYSASYSCSSKNGDYNRLCVCNY